MAYSKNLQELMAKYPDGAILTPKMLRSVGFKGYTYHRYVQAGILNPLGYGAFVKGSQTTSWLAAVSALQASDVKIYITGEAALTLNFSEDFLFTRKPFIHLFTAEDYILPPWFLKNKFEADFHITTTKRYNDQNLEAITIKGFPIKTPSKEQAILELCRFVPELYSLETVRKWVNALSDLKATLLQELLEKEPSLQAKKIFLYATLQSHHSWVRGLSIDNIKLGSTPHYLIRQKKYKKRANVYLPQLNLYVPKN